MHNSLTRNTNKIRGVQSFVKVRSTVTELNFIGSINSFHFLKSSANGWISLKKPVNQTLVNYFTEPS